jgi:putative DNA primase/helicase
VTPRTELNFDEINAAAISNLESLVMEWLPEVRREGRELKVSSLAGGKGRSLSINRDTGVWSDFAGGGGGSDPISLLAAIRGCRMLDAAKELAEKLRAGITYREAPLVDSRSSGGGGNDEWTALPHAPATASMPSIRHKRLGSPVKLWRYLDRDGVTVLGYVARFEFTEDGVSKKDVMPISWCRHNDGRETWRMKAFLKPRPLYGLDRLAAQPDAPVLIVEGEKCADIDVPGWVLVSWPGGSKAVHLADWSHIANRRVWVWPDADRKTWDDKEADEAAKHGQKPGDEKPREMQPGWMAAQRVIEKCPWVQLITPPDGKPDGWDIADAVADGVAVKPMLDAMLERDFDHHEPPANLSEPPPGYDEPPPYFGEPDAPVPEYRADRIGDMPFRLLGSNNGIFYYLPDEGGQIIELTPGGHSKNNLFQLAPLQDWEHEYGGGARMKSESWDAASNAMIQRSIRLPKFSPQRIRGRGCWIDGDDVVFHAGDHLIVNGSARPIVGYRSASRAIYDAGIEIPVDTGETARNAESARLVELCEALSWERPLYGKLLAGWLALAPICGVLSWRPHAWVTGPSGTGKSWILTNIVGPLVGKTALIAQSSTTEAGVRQTLKSDALPVILDEFESESRADVARVDKILELARQASSESDGCILRGTAGGDAMSFMVRSMFLFASIGVAAAKRSDTSRVSVLTLRKPTGTKQELEAQFDRVKQLRAASVGVDGFADRVRARCLSLAMVIRENTETFTRVAIEFTGDKRSADQIGTLLAGAFALTSNKIVSPLFARDWMAAQDWSGFQAEEIDSDERSCLNHLFASLIRVEFGNGVSESIGGLIESVIDESTDRYDFNRRAEEALGRNGIKIELVERVVVVANKHPGLGRLFADTQWPGKWSQQLERVKDARKVKPTRFPGGLISRATAVPFATLGR